MRIGARVSAQNRGKGEGGKGEPEPISRVKVTRAKLLWDTLRVLFFADPLLTDCAVYLRIHRYNPSILGSATQKLKKLRL